MLGVQQDRGRWPRIPARLEVAVFKEETLIARSRQRACSEAAHYGRNDRRAADTRLFHPCDLLSHVRPARLRHAQELSSQKAGTQECASSGVLLLVGRRLEAGDQVTPAAASGGQTGAQTGSIKLWGFCFVLFS